MARHNQVTQGGENYWMLKVVQTGLFVQLFSVTIFPDEHW